MAWNDQSLQHSVPVRPISVHCHGCLDLHAMAFHGCHDLCIAVSEVEAFVVGVGFAAWPPAFSVGSCRRWVHSATNAGATTHNKTTAVCIPYPPPSTP